MELVLVLLAGAFTLLGVLIGSVLERRRQRDDRILQARLRQIDDTQRYVMAMLEYISDIGLLGKAAAGRMPVVADYPKVSISLLGESKVVMAFADLLAAEAPRNWNDGPRWTAEDRARHMTVAIAVTTALRKQEERILAGKAPITEPLEEQYARTGEMMERMGFRTPKAPVAPGSTGRVDSASDGPSSEG